MNYHSISVLYGILLGDGCLSRYKTKRRKYVSEISITGDYYSDSDFYNFLIIPLLKQLTGKIFKIKKRPKKGTIEISMINYLLFNSLNDLGFPIGKKGTKIKINEFFYNKNLLRYLLQGFFATDGCIVLTKNPNKFYPRLEIHSISREIIFQFYIYLKDLGLKGNFYKCKRKKIDSKWKRKQQYRFQFNGKNNLILFHNLIGFINPKHEKRYLKFLKYSKTYDNKIKGISSKNQKYLGEAINKLFYRMALGRVKLPTSAL